MVWGPALLLAILVFVVCTIFIQNQIWKCFYRQNELLEQLVEEISERVSDGPSTYATKGLTHG